MTRKAKLVINLTLAALLVWFLASHQERIRSAVGNRDSIQYWATGTLLLHHQNPYSVTDVESLERSAGYSSDRPLMYRCPPWALWLVVVPGLFPAYWAWVIWLALLFASLLIANRLCWNLYRHGGDPPLIFLLVGYTFAPVVACLAAGQLGLLLLLGIVLFLAYENERPFLAGAALLIPMAKPHMFALLWPVLAVWILSRRKWTLLAGAVSAFAAAVAVAFAFDPSVIADYRAMLQQQAIQNEFIPSLSGMIRALVFHIAIPGPLDRTLFLHRFFWVQFIPLSLALLWSAFYYWKNRREWSWQRHGLALLIVAVLTTPYAWITDEVIVLPAILQGVVWLQSSRLRLGSQLAIGIFILLDVLLLLIVKAQVPPATGIFFWSSLVWFGWYWFASRGEARGPISGNRSDKQQEA